MTTICITGYINYNTAPSDMMKFAAIFITALFGTSTAAAVDHMDGNRVLQDVDDVLPQDVVSNESKPNLASALAATSPNLADQILSSAVPPCYAGQSPLRPMSPVRCITMIKLCPP